MIVKDAYDFIIKHRGTKAFVNWSDYDIVTCIDNCIINGTICYTTDTTGITGIMVGEVAGDTFHVTNILTTRRVMPIMMSFIVRCFPNVTKVTTVRHGRFHKTYPITEKVFNRLMKGTR